MLSQGRRPSDLESMSSQTTDVTSRATTRPDSVSDATLTFQQEKGPRNIQPKEEIDRSSTNTESVNTVINENTNAQRTSNNQFNQNNAGNQQQQTWVNPYWGPNAGGLQSGTSSSKGVQQLIPGSIMINDRGEIDNSSQKQTTGLDLTTLNNSSHLGGKFLLDDSNRPGGYLTPTHIQRPIVPSSPGVATHPENQLGYKQSSSSPDVVNGFRPTFNRQQTFPLTTDNNIQSWVNPYWPKTNQTASAKSTSSNGTWTNPYWKDRKPQTSTSSKPKDQPWENPYWKDLKPQTSTTSQPKDQPWENPYWKDLKPQMSTTSQPKDQPWENPYWKDLKPQTSTTSQPKDQPWENLYWKDLKPQTSTTSQPKDQPWENPYWKDSKPQNPTASKPEDKSWKNPYWKDWKPQGSTTSSQQQDKAWENPYWKDKHTSNQSTNSSALNRSLSFEHKVPPIPSFYKRIYPSSSPSSSPVPTTQHKTQFLTQTSEQNINDNDDLPFTIDSEGAAHYRAAPSSMNGTNKTAQFNSSPITSQYPVSPPDLSSAAPPSQKLFPTSSPTSVNTTSLFETNYPAPPSQKLFPTSSPTSVNTTSLFQTNYPAPPSHSSNITTSLVSNVANYPLSSPSSEIVLTEADLNSIQHALQLFATNPNSIPVIETPNQIPSSSINYPINSSSPLFTGNREQQSQQQHPLPLSNISYSFNSSSPLSSLFTRNPEQQSNQQHPLPSSNISYSVNTSSPLSSLFTRVPEQQSHQQNLLPSSSSPNIPYHSPPFSYDSNSQQLTIFSTPSYPSQSNEPLHRLITQGNILLI